MIVPTKQKQTTSRIHYYKEETLTLFVTMLRRIKRLSIGSERSRRTIPTNDPDERSRRTIPTTIPTNALDEQYPAVIHTDIVHKACPAPASQPAGCCCFTVDYELGHGPLTDRADVFPVAAGSLQRRPS